MEQENKLNIWLNLLIIIFILLFFIIGFYYLEKINSEQIKKEIEKVEVKPEEKNFLDIYSKEKLIKVKSITVDLTKRELSVSGEAVGKWFFESSFPVKLIDSEGLVLGKGIATSQADWMTDKFITFDAKFKYDKPKNDNVTLILQKDNPSGLAEYADELRINLNLKNIIK